jgi:hypothetical protein
MINQEISISEPDKISPYFIEGRVADKIRQ